MITRFAIFEGRIEADKTAAFRADVLTKILPFWKKMPGALSVRVAFEESHDAGAPSFPLILAINYPDLKAVENIINSEARAAAAKATKEVLDMYFEGHIHHHVAQANEYVL